MTTPHEPPRPYGPRRRTLRIAGVIAAALLVLGCSNPGADNDQADRDSANRAAASATTAPTTRPATTAPTTEATTTKPAPTKTTPAPVEVSDGNYTVGEDIPPGRYKVTERANDMCYWSRTDADDANDIIDNGIGGGFPSFTAKKGEALEISGCPLFRLVK